MGKVLKHRPMDKVMLGFDDPQEDEFALLKLTGASPLLDVIFPPWHVYFLRNRTTFLPPVDQKEYWKAKFRGFARKITRGTGKVPLFKNPIHSLRIPLILDGGPTSGGIESTVLDLTGGQPRILRPGPVTAAQLRRALGQPVTAIAAGPAHPQDPLPSPGMMARHYAPRIPLHCAPSDTADREARRLARGGLRVGRLAIGTPARTTPVGGGMVLRMPRTPRAYAARLYAALHEMEDSGVDCILADMPPETHAWEAVRDRLRRASAR
jgi:hypothetical protein